jgi:uncharacterized membrane protein YeaQ/YmgE (transglycosylase-associated protein family)
MFIGILGWIICGAIFGFIFSKFINLRGDDPRLGIAVAVIGGVVGGWLYSLISGSPVTHFNVWSLFYAALASLVILIVWHFIRSRSTYATPTVRRSY